MSQWFLKLVSHFLKVILIWPETIIIFFFIFWCQILGTFVESYRTWYLQIIYFLFYSDNKKSKISLIYHFSQIRKRCVKLFTKFNNKNLKSEFQFCGSFLNIFWRFLKFGEKSSDIFRKLDWRYFFSFSPAFFTKQSEFLRKCFNKTEYFLCVYYATNQRKFLQQNSMKKTKKVQHFIWI